MRISPGPTSVRELLGMEKKLTIPTFQRGYEWEKDQIEDFWSSLLAIVDGESVFFGPVVTLADPGATELQIVDGQQRLTTIFLTLSLLRDWIVDQSDTVLFAGTENQINLKTELRREMFFTDGNMKPLSDRPRFEAAERIRRIFRERVLADPKDVETSVARPSLKKNGGGLGQDDLRESKDLRRAKFHIAGLISEYLDGNSGKPSAFSDHTQRLEAVLQLRSVLIDKFEIFTLGLSSDDDAYILFESLNNRGLRLSPGDILRTISLRGVREESGHDSSDLKDALETWSTIGSNLGTYDISSYMRHYLLSVKNERVPKKLIVKKFKERIAETSAAGQIKLLERASEQYGYLLPLENHPNESLRKSSIRLNILNDTHRIALLGALIADPDPDAAVTKRQEEYFRSVEYLTFRWLLGGGNAQEVETLYQELGYRLRGRSDTIPARLDYEAAIELALEKAPSNVEVENFPRSERMVNLKYVLARIEEVTRGDLPTSWGSKGGPTLEHLAPQTPTDAWIAHVAPVNGDENALKYHELIHYWGNIAMLEAPLNKSIKNAEWSQKVSGVGKYRGLSASFFASTQALVDVPQWTNVLIKSRTDWLASLALDFVTSEWVRQAKSPKATAVRWSHET